MSYRDENGKFRKPRQLPKRPTINAKNRESMKKELWIGRERNYSLIRTLKQEFVISVKKKAGDNYTQKHLFTI